MKENITMASDMNDYFNKKKSQGEGFEKKSSGTDGNGGSGGGGNMPQMPKIDFNFGGSKAGITLLSYRYGLSASFGKAINNY
jgi:hypothetical protein